MLLVQKFLETHSLAELAQQHGVYASFSKSGHKFSLNYDQIEAKESDLLAQECRGLILASENNGQSYLPLAKVVDGKLRYDDVVPGTTTILAYPMNRFFNYGQGAAANVDWTDPKLAILEKLDGTLIIVYYDLFIGEWCVATRSVPEADIVIDGGFYTFRTLFEKALLDTSKLSFEEFTSNLILGTTYCFELTTPYNRIVVDYKESRVTLIAARHVTQGMQTVVGGETWEYFGEMNLEKVVTPGVPHVQAHTFTSVNDLLYWVSNQNPLEHEGVVVCDSNFRRLKMKNASYVAFNRARDINPLEHEGVVVCDSNFRRLKMKNASYVAFNRARDILGTSERNCLELVLSGKEDDVIPALPPEIVDRILIIKQGVAAVIKDYDRAYKLFKYASDQINLGDKKTFAIIVNGYKDIWSSPMFSMFDGKCSNMREFIDKNRKEGTWGNNFLDKMLSLIKNY